MLDQMPEEMKAAFLELYGIKEQAEAKADRREKLDYQTLQADTLLDSGKGWVEIVQTESKDLLYEAALTDSDYREALADPESFLRPPLPEGCEYSDSNEMSAVPDFRIPLTIHQFYHDLYGVSGERDEFRTDEERRKSILVNHRDREHPYQLYEDYWEFIEGVKPETSFIYMGSFWEPPSGFLIAKRNAMTTIGGFCVDIDRFEDDKGMYFQADWVMRSLLDVFDETPELEPNYLMLSGTGIQLWYVFGEQIPLLSAKKSPRRSKYEEVLRLLYKWFDDRLPKNRFRVDVPCATISHAFRAPGSPSKHHYPTRLFVKNGNDRKLISPLDLSHFLGGQLAPYDLEDWNQEEYERIKENAGKWKDEPATQKQIAYLEKLSAWHCIEELPETLTKSEADALIKQGETVATKRIQFKQTQKGIQTTEGHLVRRNARHPGIYHYTLKRMHEETPAGSRYNAMFGLAGLGWNCEIPKSQVESDLMALLDTEWAKRLGHDNKPLSRKDVRDAMRGWHPLGALRKRDQLEARLVWKYNPPAKRNGRKQAEHLAQWARPIRKAYMDAGNTDVVGGGRPTKEAEIKAYAAEHPEANHSQIARALGVSRPTVIKWLSKKDSE